MRQRINIILDLLDATLSFLILSSPFICKISSLDELSCVVGLLMLHSIGRRSELSREIDLLEIKLQEIKTELDYKISTTPEFAKGFDPRLSSESTYGEG
jgi:hypothetical protein